MSMQDQRRSRHRPDIDGLRAIAVLSVIVFHLKSDAFAAGYLGVDIFFVISGFVITMSLHNSQAGSLASFLAEFYARRIKRLLPALLAVVVVGIPMAWLVSSSPYAWFSTTTAVSSLVGASNLFLYRSAIDYWGAASDLNFFTQTWSLGVEEQFYMVFPLALFAFGLAGRNASATRRRWGIGLLGAVTGASLVSYLVMAPRSGSAVFFLLPFRFWEIGLGALLFFLVARNPLSGRVPALLAPIALGVVVVTLALPGAYAHWEIRLLLVTFATAAVILTAQSSRSVFRVLTWSPMQYVGRLSYSLYLWHWLCIVLITWTVGINGFSMVGALVLTVLSAIASHTWIERPLRYRKWSTSNVRTILLALGVVTLTIAITVPAASFARQKLAKSDPWAGVEMVHNFLNCHVPKWSNDPIQDCLTPKDLARPTIYVMGDSHSSNLIPSITAARPQYEVRYLGDSLLETSMMGMPTGELASCRTTACVGAELERRLTFLAENLRPQDRLVVAFSRDVFRYRPDSTDPNSFNDFRQGHPRTFIEGDPANVNFENALGRFAQVAQAKHSQMFIVDSLPKMCSHADYDRGKFQHPSNPCEGLRSESLADRQGASALYHRVARNFGAFILDPHSYLCPGEVCSASIDGKLWSWDGSPHFINTNPTILEPFFRAALQ